MDAELTFTAIADDPAFQTRWEQLAPALTAWYLRDGDAARPTYAQARQALHTHMPELVPTWQHMTELAGGGDLAARILALYDPPPLLAGCSQAVIDGTLVRNYDYHPDRIEATVWNSRLTRPVLGMSDCLWGLLDGINDAGLAAALAFGGRQTRGDGFGITIVVRYLLETCDTVEQAIATLERVPVHAPYNITLADTRDAATVYVGPDRAARAVRPAIATNHQEHVDWPEHALATRSVERLAALTRRGRVPRAAAIRDGVRPRLRHAVHGGVPAERSERDLPVAGHGLAPEPARLYARHADRQTPGACRPPRRRWSLVTSSPRRTSGSRC